MEIKNVRTAYMIGDTHFGTRNNSGVWKNDMIDFFYRFVEWLPEDNFDKDRDILMFTGDIFHSREFMNIMIGNAILDMFEMLSGVFSRGIFVILGNHDQYMRKNSSIHSMRLIAGKFKNIHVFESPSQLNIDGKKMLMLPWNDVAADVAETLYSDDSEYLFSHLDIDGFKYNKAVPVSNGVPRELLSKYSAVYNGHLHHRQKSGNAICLGTPYQLDYGDVDTERGWYAWRAETGELDFFKNEWSPKFVEIDFDTLVNGTFETARNLMHNNYVKVYVAKSVLRDISYESFTEHFSSRGIVARKMEFAQLLDTVESTREADASGDFNLANEARAFLSEKKYTPAEIDRAIDKFGELQLRVKNNDMERLVQ